MYSLIMGTIMFLLLLSHSARAELDTATVIQPIFPEKPARNISIYPNEIILHTAYPIDTSSIIKYSPIQYDSVQGKLFSQFQIIRKDIVEELPDSLWYRFAIDANISFISDDSIIIRLDSTTFLEYSTNYVLAISNLRIIYQGDTSIINYVINPWFETTHPPVYVIGTSFQWEHNKVMANERPIVYLSDSIKSNFTPLGKLVELGTHLTKVYLDSIHYYYEYDTVSANYNVINGTDIEIIPDTNLNIGGEYILAINLFPINGIGGVSYETFKVKEQARLKVLIKPIDTTFTLPEGLAPNIGFNEQMLVPGDITIIGVPKYLDDTYCFMGWECAEDNTLNLDTNYPALTLITTDTNLINRTLIAKYGIIPVDTIQLTTTENGGKIFINGFLDSLGNGKYTFLNRDDFTMSLYFAPALGFKFEAWTSDDPRYNGKADNPMSISGAYRNNHVPIGIGIGDPIVTPAPTDHCSCAEVNIHITFNTREHPHSIMRYEILPAVANGVFPIGFLIYEDLTDTVHIGFQSKDYGYGSGSICGTFPLGLYRCLSFNE